MIIFISLGVGVSKQDNKTFHFIAGLPRSGTTLLSAILSQNPKFHAGMSSPVAILSSNLIDSLSVGTEFDGVVSRETRRDLVKGLFTNYYKNNPQSVVFDTNRMWCARMQLVKDVFPKAKVIACVRDVAWVMDSLERLYRANPYENTKLFAHAEKGTVYTRTEALLSGNRLLGYSLSAVKDAFYGEHASSVLLVDYDLLVAEPEKVMRLIYSFIGEEWFEHDFTRLSYSAEVFDRVHGIPGMHTVKAKIELNQRKSILPPDLFERCHKLSFWQQLKSKP